MDVRNPLPKVCLSWLIGLLCDLKCWVIGVYLVGVDSRLLLLYDMVLVY